MILDKFLPPFIDFMDKNFGRNNHKYVFITSEKYAYGLKPEHQVEFLHTDDDIFITLLSYMKEARKIIIHGLWRDKVNSILVKNKHLLKKSYWGMWGGDFYFPETKSYNTKIIIKEMGFLITQNIGDLEYIRRNYQAKGKHIKISTGYPSNQFKSHKETNSKSSYIKLLIGNSATETNNHLEIIEKIKQYRNKEIKIYAPLSYGSINYAKKISKIGKINFGNKFVPLLDFMPFSKYMDFLNKIDIAIFNHERQQAFGNIITLLGMGKKVYINKKSTIYNMLKNKNIAIFDLESITLEKIDEKEKIKNISIIKNNFSISNLIDDWKKIIDT